ncbi:hypothetical protein [Acetobacter orleanensis]|uniref:Uncharacterized protein n=1 Tax=Acetobacter orleanensis TaxID=104099 RepID=A0A4Y3TN16_9PROT|nr:hypothetical protein [Acetobacter orleanensis]KXV63933.1 hypothetical protein AD949_06420 [Acetobacter orleanensis]PCD79706.1 hypothetical protein CO710_05740 [Acetobacter orleanensis]GAN69269.1 hypothetical protein Abol_030_034 [Acetobacter orleanensis JCM 7639]GBR28247.1 hypothetical protein AA0473_1684 [Acetobacter orleanensis NRIC 0473]GEB82205.1 hypothetical protein AOR01nite_06820 [Acetobacter orleanensis]
MTKKAKIVLLAGSLLLGGAALQPHAPAQARTVHLTAYNTSTVVSGTVEGAEIMPFHLALREGQRLDVLCHSRKKGVFFVVKDPSGTVIYKSAESPQPDRWTGQAAFPGKYTLAVYQQHPATRKGQPAFFRLHLTVAEASDTGLTP